METLNPKFALYGSKSVSARINTVFFPPFEVSSNAVRFFCNPSVIPSMLETFTGGFSRITKLPHYYQSVKYTTTIFKFCTNSMDAQLLCIGGS